MACLSSFFGVAVVLLFHSLPNELSISWSILRALAFEVADNVVGRTGGGKEQHARETLVCLCPCSLANKVGRDGVTNAENKRKIGFALKHVENGSAVERMADSKFYLKPEEALLVLASKDRAAFYPFLGFL